MLQLLQQVLGYCGPRELGVLEATCSYFIKSGLTDRIAKHFLRDIPRAKGLKPAVRCAEIRCRVLQLVSRSGGGSGAA